MTASRNIPRWLPLLVVGGLLALAAPLDAQVLPKVTIGLD